MQVTDINMLQAKLLSSESFFPSRSLWFRSYHTRVTQAIAWPTTIDYFELTRNLMSGGCHGSAYNVAQ